MQAFEQLSVRLVLTTTRHSAQLDSALAILAFENEGHRVDMVILDPTDEFAGSFRVRKSYFSHEAEDQARGVFPTPLEPTAVEAVRMEPAASEHFENMKSSKEVALLLRTSGTTSTPKVVPLKLDAIIGNGVVRRPRRSLLNLTSNLTMIEYG